MTRFCQLFHNMLTSRASPVNDAKLSHPGDQTPLFSIQLRRQDRRRSFVRVVSSPRHQHQVGDLDPDDQIVRPLEIQVA